MFFGTTPQIISQFLVEEIKRIKPARVIVPFAGNFVVEQLAAIVDQKILVLSTDISLYSRLIGYGIIGRECGIRLKDEILEDFPILRNRQTPRDKAIEVIFMA